MKNTELNSDSTQKKSLRERIKSSVIVSFFLFLASTIYQKLGNGFYGKLTTSYSELSDSAENSATSTLLHKIRWGEKVSRPFKQTVARWFERSLILQKINSFAESLLYCAQRAHGVFCLSFGLYVEIIFFIKLALSGDGILDGNFTPMVVGAVLMIISLPLIFSAQTLAEGIRESKIAAFAVFRIAGANPESFEKDIRKKDHLYTPFIAGMILGLLSIAVNPLYIVLGIVGLVLVYSVVNIPEFGVFIIAVAAPFAPTMVLAALTLFVTLCALLKIVCGKRSVKFGLIDLAITVFGAITILGGIVSPDPSGSIKPALIYTVFILAYFLVANLIRTRQWLNRCLWGMTLSLFAVSAYGIMQYVFGFGAVTWQDTSMFSDISGRVFSTFENPNVLAEYLIMLIPLAIALVFDSSKHSAKGVALVTLAASVLCLVFTWSRGAWLGFIFGVLVFLLIYSKKILAALFALTALIPFLPFVLPDSVINRFSSIGNIADSSTSYRVNIWTGVMRMLKDHWFTGIGTGLPAFSKVYPGYSLSGIESAPHAHNLFLQIITEHGVVALIIFILIIFLFVQSVFSFGKYESGKSKLTASALMCGILAVLLQGLTDYIWYNYRVYLIFWLVIGLTTAVRRTHSTSDTL